MNGKQASLWGLFLLLNRAIGVLTKLTYYASFVVIQTLDVFVLNVQLLRMSSPLRLVHTLPAVQFKEH